MLYYGRTGLSTALRSDTYKRGSIDLKVLAEGLAEEVITGLLRFS